VTSAIYVATENPAHVAGPAFKTFNLSTYASFTADVIAAGLPPPASATGALLDQLVCSRARALLLNAFSTFSQVVVVVMAVVVMRDHLLLNAFSTFSQVVVVVMAVVVMRDHPRPSQLVMVHICLRNAQALGWVRDLSRAHQKALKLQVDS